MRLVVLYALATFGCFSQAEAQDMSASDEAQTRAILMAAIAKYDTQQGASTASETQEKAKIWAEIVSQAQAKCTIQAAEEPAIARQAAAAGFYGHESFAQAYADCMKDSL